VTAAKPAPNASNTSRLLESTFEGICQLDRLLIKKISMIRRLNGRQLSQLGWDSWTGLCLHRSHRVESLLQNQMPFGSTGFSQRLCFLLAL